MMSSFSQSIERWAVEELGAKISGNWANLKAPCHEDHSASGRLCLTDGWFWCHACGEGCWSDQLAKEYGLTLPPEKEGAPKYSETDRSPRRTVAEYIYKDADGKSLYKCVKRIENGKKRFAQARWTGNDWDFSGGALDNVDRVLFDLPTLIASTGPVLFVEGEKDVRAAQRLGFNATTAPQGAGKGKADKVSDWSPLMGREVVIIPDNDKPGREHANRVCELLKDVAVKVEIFEIPGQPDKGDLSDWIRRGGTRQELNDYIGIVLSHATPSRRWVERSYLVSEWDSETGSQILSTFSITRWRDKAARAAVVAIKELISEERPVEPVTIGNAMRERGQFDLFQELNDFESDLLRRGKIRENSNAARELFLQTTRWDDLSKIILGANKTLGKGDPNKVTANLIESLSALLAQDTTEELKTVAQICEQYLDRVAEGVESKESFHVPILSPLSGNLGGGDVVPICGPPQSREEYLDDGVGQADC